MSLPVETTPRGRPRDPRRGEAVLRAAIELVAEVGYDRMTVEALAERAGVSKPTVYRRWPGGKAEIVIEAMRSKHAEHEIPDHGSLRADLLAYFGVQFEHINEDIHLAAGLITRLRESEELARLLRQEAVAEGRHRFEAIVERAIGRGELPADASISPLVGDIPGSLMFLRGIVFCEPLDQSFVEELVDEVLLPILLNPLPKDS